MKSVNSFTGATPLRLELFLVCTTGVSLGAGVDPAKRRQLPPTAKRFDQ
jgi:hypothetical protein